MTSTRRTIPPSLSPDSALGFPRSTTPNTSLYADSTTSPDEKTDGNQDNRLGGPVEHENDPDSDDAIEKYRLATDEAPQKPEKSLNAEDNAFRAWIASEVLKEPTPKAQDDGDKQPSISDLVSHIKSNKIIDTPRQYQLDLFERAKKDNTIVVLDTGSGKTLIAVLLLRYTLDNEQERRAQGQPNKVAFFLVDKVVLCLQQCNVLRANLAHQVGIFYGSTVSGLRTKDDWSRQVQDNMVIVCTAQILLDLLGSGLVEISQINLLIFDEAHHTKKNHPYARIVRDYYTRTRHDRPRILGMTASPVDSRTGDLHAAALNLEATLCSKVATISDEALAKHMDQRKQTELLVKYSPLRALGQVKTQLWEDLNVILSMMSEFRPHLDAAQDVGSDLGPWCADQYWNLLFTPSGYSRHSSTMHHVVELNQGDAIKPELLNQSRLQKLDTDTNLDLDHSAMSVARAKRTIRDHMERRTHITSLEDVFSDKLVTLHNTLSDAFSNGTVKRCIVFVRKRYIACLLSDAFQQHGVRIPNMRTAYVIGSQTVSSSIANMSINDQFQTLYKFREGEINCLFATQVAEEGIDIPDCDLIVRFDLYDSTIQYIQSKGRARQAESTYINMLERDNVKHIRRLTEASREALALRRFVSSLSEDRKVDIEVASTDLQQEQNKTLVFNIPETGAQLTLDSSQQVLARFVSSLAYGGNAHPEYVVTPTYCGGKFVATIILPDSSPVKSFRGTPQRSKLLARSSAAFRACIEMIKRKYINGHLQPTLSRRLPAMRNARLAISSHKQSEYNMRLRPNFWSQTGHATELFVTILTIDGSGSALPGKTGRPLCILTRSRLPSLEPIQLYIGKTKTQTADLLECAMPIRVSESDLCLLGNFTLVLFRDVFSKDFSCKSEELPYFIAPCTSGFHKDTTLAKATVRNTIDWALLDSANKTNNSTSSKCNALGEFENRLASDPWDGSRKFLTGTVEQNLRPFDSVPEGVPTHHSRSYRRVEPNIAEYSNSLSINSRLRSKWDADQPVFHAELLPLRRNFLCQPANDELIGCRSCYIILEPLVISPVPVDVVATALAVPVIMYRIDSVAISLDACRLLNLDIKPALALEALTKDSLNTEQHGGQQIDFQPGMGKNYERLEFLGDAFLKMATTISLFTLLPKNDEFEYHVERMVLVCNQNLFNHAVDNKLQEYVRSKAFDRRTWYPDLELKKGKASKTRITHSLADKSIADVCEAIIGAAYMSEPEGQMDLAVKAVTKMVKSKNHRMVKFSDYYDQYEIPAWQTRKQTAAEQHSATKFQESIGYTFKSPTLLRSAFKHPSYPYEQTVPHYQRLEFLGDALLDLAAVDYLFKRFPNADPQWLTEHKMAMVSNHFFACLSIELDLHRHLLTANSSMIGKIASFAEKLKEAKVTSTHGRMDNNNPDPNYWVNVLQPPKALSDMLEAVVGAMFVDSEYDYDVVRKFFDKFITPFFQDITLYDTYAAGHPVTVLTKRMQDVFNCHSWRLCVSVVPSACEAGAAAITGENVVCACMVHGNAVAHDIREGGRDAKVNVATKVLRLVQDMDKAAFRAQMGCDCT
ncbi:Dicer-like protein 1 [Conoideocrella luteorostrata]|uniref:Dicer-like protein 1 n=1 Tax=Conoideocrella luteorostrata TaxID=1105319 RepID=A0AAJ0CYC2_9HYPO|nr:Dicer-like protein 1 [Conoideocrella luteorostrata]